MKTLFQMLANTADGAFVVDENQRIVYWSPAAQQALGYTADQVLGRLCCDIIKGYSDGGQLVCQCPCAVAASACSGKTIPNYDLATRTNAGDMRWINVSILTTDSPDSHASPLVVHLFRDATRIKRNEQFVHQMFNTTDPQQAPETPAPNQKPPSAQLDTLTEREQEVLSLLATGAKTAGIAETLSISPTTVRNHIQNILHKLQVHSRLEAVVLAVAHRLSP